MTSFRHVRELVALAVPLVYIAHVLQISGDEFWRAGLAYWLDPYFINALMESWYVSVLEGADPSSPPMYYPAQKTLAYSHGLVLFAPFYIPFRLSLHPFLAYNWMVFAVLAFGAICLYVLFRKLALSTGESLALSALFYTSRNALNEPLSAWTQRASVFLIPPILLLMLVSWRWRTTGTRVAVAALAGCLSTLMYVQDFYTAHLAMLFVALCAAAIFFAEGGVRRTDAAVAPFVEAQTLASTTTLIVALAAAGWAAYVAAYGGGTVEILGIRVRSTDAVRPALVAAVGLAAFVWFNRRFVRLPRVRRLDPWWTALTIGAAIGAGVFLWIYAGAYREHRAFPEEHLVSQLLPRDPSDWTGPLDTLRWLDPYDASRSFVFVALIAVAVWIPRVGASRRVRFYWSWLAGVSLVVFLVPLRFGDFSIWRTLIEPIPGYGVIRDPKRIVYLYELVVPLAAAALAASLRPRTAARAAIMLLAVALIVTGRSRPDRFRYHRPLAVFDRWVAAPIALDPACESFYIKGASREYMSRSDHMWSQYALDALFVALRLGIPTLNGYSAWAPTGWDMMNPHEPHYEERVQRWIDANRLSRVCEFDIDTRKMTLRRGGS